MGRVLRILLGPLPATALLLPILFAGGLGAIFALGAAVAEPGRSAAERWANAMVPAFMIAWITAAAIGVLALWMAVLADPRALRQTPTRWWLAAGLGLGCVAAGRFLWFMGWGGHHYDRATWLLWLLLLVGPLVLGGFYLVQRRPRRGLIHDG